VVSKCARIPRFRGVHWSPHPKTRSAGIRADLAAVGSIEDCEGLPLMNDRSARNLTFHKEVGPGMFTGRKTCSHS